MAGPGRRLEAGELASQTSLPSLPLHRRRGLSSPSRTESLMKAGLDAGRQAEVRREAQGGRRGRGGQGGLGNFSPLVLHPAPQPLRTGKSSK